MANRSGQFPAGRQVLGSTSLTAELFSIISYWEGPVTQRLECHPYKMEVLGSIPSRPTLESVSDNLSDLQILMSANNCSMSRLRIVVNRVWLGEKTNAKLWRAEKYSGDSQGGHGGGLKNLRCQFDSDSPHIVRAKYNPLDLRVTFTSKKILKLINSSCNISTSWAELNHCDSQKWDKHLAS